MSIDSPMEPITSNGSIGGGGEKYSSLELWWASDGGGDGGMAE